MRPAGILLLSGRRARLLPGLGVGAALALAGCAAPALPPAAPVASAITEVDAELARARANPAAARLPDWLQPRPVDLSRDLTPDDVALLAVLANPDLRALRRELAVAEAQVFAAGLLPDPVFSFGADFVIGGPATAFGAALASSLGQDLGLLRTRAASLAGARARARQVRLDVAWAEWLTAGQARLLATQLLGAEIEQALLADIDRLTRDLFARTLRAAARGDISGEALQAARLAEVDAAAQLQAAELAVVRSREELLRTLGLPPGTALRLAPPAGAPLVPDCDALAGLVPERLDLAALTAGIDAADADVRAARLEAFPAPALTVNASRNEGGNRFAGPALGLSLPLWNRGRGTLAVAAASREALRDQHAARLFQARADIASLCAQQQQAGLQLERLRQDLPDLEGFAGRTGRAAARGDLAQSAAETARLAMLSRLLLIRQVEQAERERAIGLELVTGRLATAWPREGMDQ